MIGYGGLTLESIELTYPELSEVTKAIKVVLGISIDDMRVRKRTAELSLARQLVCNICLDVPCNVIGQYLNRDHCTVVKHRAKANDLMSYNKVYKRSYVKVLNQMEQN